MPFLNFFSRRSAEPSTVESDSPTPSRSNSMVIDPVMQIPLTLPSSTTRPSGPRRTQSGSNTINRARFEPPTRLLSMTTLKKVGEAVKNRLRNPSQPSTTSQSAFEDGTGGTGSLAGWRKPGPGGSVTGRSASGYEGEEDPTEPVSVVVLDGDLGLFMPTSKSDSGSAGTPGTGFESADDEGGHPMTPSHTQRRSSGGGDGSSIRRDRRRHWVTRTKAWELVVDRCWPAFYHFCDSSFPEANKEKSYQKEAWFAFRPTALAAASFYVVAWTLTTALMSAPYTSFEIVGYIVAPAIFIVPLPLMVIFDWVRHFPIIYQIWLLFATWAYSIVFLVNMHTCNFFGGADNHCGGQTFLALFYWSLGLPVFAILALGQKRHYHMIGAITWVGNVIGLLLVTGSSPASMYRNVVNFILFHLFLLGTSYLKEKSERQMFTLRTQLKLQYRATQAAQVAERKASDSKKRFVSYLFHEIRVPLNAALLAVQNLEGEQAFEDFESDQKDLINGLTGSLQLMGTVLNDVLSFNRMESGQFTQAKAPFDIHKAVDLVALSHRGQVQHSGLQLLVETDPEIDKLGGIFIGDEMRLRQVMSNFVSNACKFTPSGSIRIVTKLLYPRTDSTGNTPADEKDYQHMQAEQQTVFDAGLGNAIEMREKSPQNVMSSDSDKTIKSGELVLGSPAQLLSEKLQDRRGSEPRESTSSNRPAFFGARMGKLHADSKAIIRVEIHDTGVGLAKRDVVDNRLFSPYVQTEIGRRQGGKGSGLGLALCQQIIRLSGGRLGVDSQLGKGSCFWFEVALLLPPPAKTDLQVHVRSPLSLRPATTTELPPVIASDMHYNAGHGLLRPSLAEFGAHSSLRPLMEDQAPPARVEIPLDEPGIIGATDSPPRLSAENAVEAVQTDISIRPGELLAPLNGERRESDVSTVYARKDSAPSSSKALRSQAPPSGFHALVVDDDTLTRKLMCRMLQRLGHTTSQAENGEVAFNMIRDRHISKEYGPQFDMVFLDKSVGMAEKDALQPANEGSIPNSQMPKMSGIECIREVRKLGCEIFCAGATGNALKEDQEEYLDGGGDVVLTKPVKESSIKLMVEEAKRRVRGETTANQPGQRRDL